MRTFQLLVHVFYMKLTYKLSFSMDMIVVIRVTQLLT